MALNTTDLTPSALLLLIQENNAAIIAYAAEQEVKLAAAFDNVVTKAAEQTDVAALQAQIALANEAVAIAQLAADNLSSVEEGRVREIALLLLQTPEIAAMFATGLVTIKGNQYTVSDALNKIAGNDDVTEWSTETAGMVQIKQGTVVSDLAVVRTDNGADVTFDVGGVIGAVKAKKSSFTGAFGSLTLLHAVKVVNPVTPLF